MKDVSSRKREPQNSFCHIFDKKAVNYRKIIFRKTGVQNYCLTIQLYFMYSPQHFFLS